MLSGKDTHHRPVGCFRHPAGCRFNAFPGQFYTMPQRKSSGFPYLRHGIPADPSAPASAPPLRWRRQRIFEAWGPFDYKRVIHGDASHAGVSLALPWGMTAWPTVQQNGAVGDPAYLIYIYISRDMIRHRRADKNGDGTPSVLSSFLALEGTRRRRRRQGQAAAHGRRAVRAPRSAARQGAG